MTWYYTSVFLKCSSAVPMEKHPGFFAKSIFDYKIKKASTKYELFI